MGELFEYQTTIALEENRSEYSHINIYSKTRFNKKEFEEIVKKVFNKYRDEVVFYSMYDVWKNSLISSSEYDKLEFNANSVSELGPETYPAKFKLINTHLLTKFILLEHPEFTKKIETDLVKVDRIYV